MKGDGEKKNTKKENYSYNGVREHIFKRCGVA